MKKTTTAAAKPAASAGRSSANLNVAPPSASAASAMINKRASLEKPLGKDVSKRFTSDRRASIKGEQKLPSMERVGSEHSLAYDHDDYQPVEVKKVPEDQIKDLTPEQMVEVFTKSLNAMNPNVSKSITRFNFKERTFKVDSSVDQLTVHFHMESMVMHPDGEEAKALSREKKDKEVDGDVPAPSVSSGGTDAASGSEENGGRALKNQFNYSDRASQTFNNPKRDREVATEPPPCQDFHGNVTQWEIFDAYLADFAQTLAAKNTKESSKSRKAGDDKVGTASSNDDDEDKAQDNPALLSTLKIMERMVNQNAENEIFHDFRYYENENDQVREDGKGEFLPLWRFQYAPSKKRTITALKWNPKYADLFAVGYGSYDFMKQGPGLICCFSLKNTAFPEYSFTTHAGVMCIDFHPQQPNLLAVGLYDGTVCVFDVKSKVDKPLYVASDPKVKHTDPVWQVHWQEQDPTSKVFNFFSVSSDGRITNWIMNKNELANEEVVELKLSARIHTDEQSDDPAAIGLAGGSCFDFNKRSPHLFAVGTEEGAVQTYSKAYNTQLVENYEGHHMAVYGVRWNPFHQRVFLSCSADWTVKMWEINQKDPIMTFDLSNAVGDVAWAPFSSTVFATITSDGRLMIYDLSVNKHEPIGESRIVKKAKLTHISFNPTEPIILVGDDSGVVMSLKLSPNLKKMSAPKIEDLDPKTEAEKLDKLFALSEKQGDSFLPRIF